MAGIMKPPYVKIYLQTFEDTISDEFGRKMFNIIWGEDILLTPQRYGVTTRGKTEYTNIDILMLDWPYRVALWNRNKKLKYSASFKHKQQSEVGLNPSVFHFRSTYSPLIDWEEKFYLLCDIFKPRVGMMHLFSALECKEDNSTYDFRYGSFGAIWQPTVPGLGWMFAAGERFYKPTKEIDLEGTGVERKDFGDYVTIKTAKSDTEIIENYHDFHCRRAQIIPRFPQKYFPTFHRLTNPQIKC